MFVDIIDVYIPLEKWSLTSLDVQYLLDTVFMSIVVTATHFNEQKRMTGHT